MALPITIRYDLDRTGKSLDHRVLSEPHTLIKRQVRPIAPINGPFYTDTVVVRDSLTGQELIRGVDWRPAEMYTTATLNLGMEVHALILIINTSISDNVEIDYNVVGGEYSYNLFALQEMVNNLNLDNRPQEWGNIIGKPNEFPPGEHLHDIGDTYGWEYINQALVRIEQAILMGDRVFHDAMYEYIDLNDGKNEDAIDDLESRFLAHAARRDNPHGVTKAQVGLGSVENYGISTKAEAEAGTSNVKYMTPLRVAEAIAKQAGDLLNAHIADKNNPHNVTKAQAGLGSVLNYGIATKVEAEDGAVNNKYMTPIRVREAISKQAGELLDLHLNDFSNPHQVTKAQVGLGSVENYPVASKGEAEAGTVSNKYMTPLRVSEAITAQVGNRLNTHINNKNNPHEVTKAQVGLGNVLNYGIASTAEAETGTSNVKYMTPLRVKEAISKQAGDLLDAHIADKNNPHNVTKAQVGLGSVLDYGVATKNQAEDGVVNNKYMTPLRTKEAITLQAVTPLNSHVNNRLNPHGVTKAQVGLGSVENYGIASTAEAETGTSNVKYMTPLRTKEAITLQAVTPLNSHVNSRSNPHGVTKAQVGLGSVENYGIATQAEAQAGTVNNKYMTPLRVANAIATQAGALVNAHANLRNNPHGVTKAQVGLGNIPNSITSSRATNSNDTLLTAAGMYNHANSGDHDGRYVRHSSSPNLQLRESNGQFQALISGSWRIVWPPQWQ